MEGVVNFMAKKRSVKPKIIEKQFGHNLLIIYFDGEGHRPGWTWRVKIDGDDEWARRALKWFLTPKDAEDDFLKSLTEMN